MPNAKKSVEETDQVNSVTETKKQVETNATTKSTKTSKAGKRSAKAIAAAQVKQEKEARKSEKAKTEATLPKPAVNRTRSLLERRSKSYREKYELIDPTKRYELKEAAALIGKTNPVKFDATIELSVRLGVDPKQAEQNIRDSVLLPAGSGRQVRVAVFADGEDATIAEEAGAELVGEAEVIKELEAGSFSFDVLIASPLEMPKLGKYARLLGPRGLMPNPKSGTVTTDIGRAVRESKAGKIEYRVDSGGNLHLPIGKTSFTPEKILQNVEAALTSIQSNRPATLKGTYMLSASLSTSMGPALKLAI